jgi:hypothetical protein
MLQRLSVEDAARHLGLSQQTVKRRLKKGTLRGEQEPTSTGFRWYVVLDTPGTTVDVSGDVSGTSADTTADIPADTPSMALQTARAQEMAAYTRALVEPLYARLEAQAELEQARARQNAAPVQERRSWWAWLVGG